MWAGNLVRARLLARKGIVDPTDFTSLLAWRLESNVSDVPDVPDVPDAPAELLSWEGVAYHTANGTYKDVYAVGDMIPLDLGSEGVINMQIAAFDADTLADGSGTAAISWAGEQLLATMAPYNTATTQRDNGAYVEGTGGIGGWASSALRKHLENNIKPLIPAKVQNIIVTVAINHVAYGTDGNFYMQTTNAEVFTLAPTDYTILYPDNTSKIKTLVTTGKAQVYWDRSVGDKSNCRYFTSTGSVGNTKTVTSKYGVSLGFCTGRTPT